MVLTGSGMMGKILPVDMHKVEAGVVLTILSAECEKPATRTSYLFVNPKVYHLKSAFASQNHCGQKMFWLDAFVGF